MAGLHVRSTGLGEFVEKPPVCPSGGKYTFGADTIPLIGQLYDSCSLASSRHVSTNHADG